MRQNVITVNGKQISYWDNMKLSYERSVVILPPGASTGERFIRFEKKLNKRIRLVFPDYLGRGMSYRPTKREIIKSQAEAILLLFKKLKLHDITLVGMSYGTAVANEMLKLSKNKNIKKVVYVAPGEFYDGVYKTFYKIIFLPAKHSETIRKIYKYFVNKITPGLLQGDTDLENILMQWYAILDYKFEYKGEVDKETIFVLFKKDTIVNKNSLEKILLSYPKHSLKYFDLKHPRLGYEWDYLFNKIHRYF